MPSHNITTQQLNISNNKRLFKKNVVITFSGVSYLLFLASHLNRLRKVTGIYDIAPRMKLVIK